jgi:hypothetical protein
MDQGFLNILDINNLTISIKAKSLLLDGRFDWVLGIEDLVEFLECAVFGLWDP